ncbi:MAG: acyl-CoA reductase [Flavisolibacter sp.]
MNLNKRKELLVQLGDYLIGTEEKWQEVKMSATAENPWFTPEFIEVALHNISTNFLQSSALESFISTYGLSPEIEKVKKVGIVMAGNIPLVGFHDLLCVFLSGHHARVKPSSKDQVMIRHIIEKLNQWDGDTLPLFDIQTMIPNCDAYIATGSNNTARYFEYYFKKYPSIIRRNRTSVALLSGKESKENLQTLAADVYIYFGLGCRNVTKLYLPQTYDFLGLLEAFRKYDHLKNHHKYKNNFDHHLALHILNNKYFMTNDSISLIEEKGLFSPISQLHYEYYSDEAAVVKQLSLSDEIQCIIGKGFIPFGQAQSPTLFDFADGIDTMKFLSNLG